MRRQHALDPGYARGLFERRRAAGLSQLDVALVLGCSESTISKYERLAIPVPPHAREGIERALDGAGLSRELVAV